tara:strand:- start:245 stop:481 length:237 start_codon:yes stop_codon:yes gene_type:complete
MEHFEILKVGAEPNKRFLVKGMCQPWVRWSSQHYAHKFFTLKEASDEASSLENVVIIWVNGNTWGEVNSSVLDSVDKF